AARGGRPGDRRPRGSRRRGRGRARTRARSIVVTGVELAVEAELLTARNALLALRRHPDDRRLDRAALRERAADRGARLSAERGRFAARDEIATWPVRNELRNVRFLYCALHALHVRRVLLVGARASTVLLDEPACRLDGRDV